MENNSGSDSLDKNKVMNVRPLRCLVPIFPSPPGVSSSSSPQTAPFVCAPPTGPFPPGFNSFYPFLFPPDSQKPGENLGFNNAIPAPTPISSFGGPVNGEAGPAKGDQYLSGFTMHIADTNEKAGKKRKNTSSSQKRGTNRDSDDIEAIANKFLSSFNLAVFDTARKSDGDAETVRYVLTIMNFLRRRISQIEDSKEGSARRPDLRAGAFLMNKGIRTNMTKRVGDVPGVEVGDIFFFRMELCMVGMHAPSMAGIDYLTIKLTQSEEPIAVSIVSSGGYEDNNEDSDVLIYSGQGGNVNKKDKYIDLSDQKLERGNLALEKSLHRGNEVRVIRGLKDTATLGGKIYMYDGLYKIQESWIEKGKSGFNVFKYKLVRNPGQPQGFALWKSIQQWKEVAGSRPGLILPDLTSGAEVIPVSIVNEVDGEKGPGFFTYFPGIKYPRPINLPQISSCSCLSGCQIGDLSCSCVQKNQGILPYNALGILMSFKSIVHECGSLCSCPVSCRNRIPQSGLRVHLEVFKTRNKGWGLRSLDPIRSGTFICEYAGEAIDKSMEEQMARDNGDTYVFDSTRTFEPREIMLDDSDESAKMPFPLVISAKSIGNVARFMNHSCSPNVYWQPIMREMDNESYLHVLFFAINHIPPMKELTFDYGVIKSGNAENRKKKCLCGSVKCRGYFY